MSSLFHGGKHRVACHGSLSVGKSANLHLFGHFYTCMFQRVEYAYCSIIVNGKVSVGWIVHRHQFWCLLFSRSAVVAHRYYAFVYLYAVFKQRVFVTVKTVFRYLQLQWTSIECYAFAPRFYQMGYGIKCPHIIVNHHSAGVNSRAYSVVEHHGYACIYQLLVVIVVLCVFCLRYNHAAHLLSVEVIAYLSLSLILLATQCHHYSVASCSSCFFYAGKNRREIIMCKLWHNYANYSYWHHAAVA